MPRTTEETAIFRLREHRAAQSALKAAIARRDAASAEVAQLELEARVARKALDEVIAADD